MMKKNLIFLFCFISIAIAKEVPPRPINSYVYDENRLLSQAETKIFNEISEELYRKTGVGLAAALFQNIGDEEPRDFALQIASTWKVGNKNDEGVLIFVTLDEKRRSVETGYGAEIFLPDALVERIQQRTLVPAFRQKKYGEGVLLLALGLSEEIAKAKNVSLDFSKISGNKKIQPNEQKLSPLSFLVFLLLAVFLIATPTGRAILIYALLSSLGGGGRSGGSSRGGFGGGFGGGRFGGGGSGGSW
ncbi:MAG: TPM domain-containing protein [Fibrobacteraceae bacterium]|nr:TPM domain-containing protein [Fibrobacteraceae bacterium]